MKSTDGAEDFSEVTFNICSVLGELLPNARLSNGCSTANGPEDEIHPRAVDG